MRSLYDDYGEQDYDQYFNDVFKTGDSHKIIPQWVLMKVKFINKRTIQN